MTGMTISSGASQQDQSERELAGALRSVTEVTTCFGRSGDSEHVSEPGRAVLAAVESLAEGRRCHVGENGQVCRSRRHLPAQAATQEDGHMLRRGTAVQNRMVARRATWFFRRVDRRLLGPEDVAREYARRMRRLSLHAVRGAANRPTRNRYTVVLGAGDDADDFDRIIRPATMVSDTLLLSHDGAGSSHPLRRDHWTHVDADGRPLRRHPDVRLEDQFPDSLSAAFIGGWGDPSEQPVDDVREHWEGMRCPDLGALGRWLLRSRELLETGAVWYLPTYLSGTRTVHGWSKFPQQRYPADVTWTSHHSGVVDYLAKDGRAVVISGTRSVRPVESRLVRPILSTDLPFLDGVDPHTFNAITVQELASHAAFRDVLRQTFLELDQSMNAVQSARELTVLGRRIEDQIRGVESQMRRIGTNRTVVRSVGAVLVVVNASVMHTAVAAAGANGDVWASIDTKTENDELTLRDSTWCYVWALASR